MWLRSLLLASGLGLLWYAPQAVEENRVAFQQLDPVSQREMLRKWERFQALSPAEQARWREFDQRLATHPEAEQLRVVMNQYYQWNSSLNDRKGAELRTGSVDLRMERVHRYRLEQYEQNLGRDESTRLSLDEIKILREWFRSTWMRRGREGRGGRDPRAGNGAGAVVTTNGGAAERGGRREGLDRAPFTEAELDDLQARFTEKGEKAAALMQQRKTRSADGKDERLTLVLNWGEMIMQPTSAMLKSVYETLDEQERMALTELPDMTPDAIEQKLRAYYFERLLPGFRPPGAGAGRGERRPDERRSEERGSEERGSNGVNPSGSRRDDTRPVGPVPAGAGVGGGEAVGGGRSESSEDGRLLLLM